LTEEKFLKVFSIDPHRIQVIHPGVDIDRFRRLDRKRCRQEVRHRFGVDESDTLLLFVSMNFELKGLDTLIASMAEIKKRQPSERLKLLVVGKGNEKKFARLAAEYGLAGDVIFTGVWKEDIERVYMASDIFSMLSKFDTFGMVVLEAMSASLPVVISENVGAKDLVRDGVNGYVVKGDDVSLVSVRIESLLAPRVRERMAEEAYREALNHTWDKMAERVLQVYNEILPA
jgi:UDP-glucose:(heptosyl)LPS alpha-1,3-glucosyltransferase